MTDREQLTERQQQVLDFIQRKISRDGYPPTIREIGDQLGIRSTNGVNDHLKALSRKGYLQRTESKSRACVPTTGKAGLTKPPRVKSDVEFVDFDFGQASNEVDIPILGKIAAGQPILALETQEDSVRIDRMFLGKTKDRDVFALRVVGESMIEDGINDGDFIFVKKQRVAAKGAIVVALIDDEATVKRYYHEGDRIRFQPSNSTMKPIYVAANEFRDTQILGVVVGIYRRMD